MIQTKSIEKVLIAKNGQLTQRPYTSLGVTDKKTSKNPEVLKCESIYNHVVGMLATFGLVLQFKKWFIVSD